MRPPLRFKEGRVDVADAVTNYDFVPRAGESAFLWLRGQDVREVFRVVDVMHDYTGCQVIVYVERKA